MASVGPIEVGIKITDPNWQLLCVALTGHSMRALGYLEAERPDLALGALRDARAAGDLAMMCRAELPDNAKEPEQVQAHDAQAAAQSWDDQREYLGKQIMEEREEAKKQRRPQRFG